MNRKKVKFIDFINNKPLYYKRIDHRRIKVAYHLLKPHIKRPLTIHIVGTNGKGSTGRIIATLLHHSGYKVGHFSSPHILKFNERIWIRGDDISDELLEIHHFKLYQILGQKISEKLSYFEYTTLLALVATENMDVMVLEAGLGGEFDATNVVQKELTVITPIGLDHQQFLGNRIDIIATTKLNSIDKKVLLGLQPYRKVYKIADNIARQKGCKVYKTIKNDDEVLIITQKIGWSKFLYQNALLAITALRILNLPYKIQNLQYVKIFGRFQQIAPNIIIDVGHNLLATEVVKKALKERFGKNKVVLVYNTLNDKNYSDILKKIKRQIKRVEIIDIESDRCVDMVKLEEVLEKLFIEYRRFKGVDKDENYLVFGSFFVVEAFIKKNYFKI